MLAQTRKDDGSTAEIIFRNTGAVDASDLDMLCAKVGLKLGFCSSVRCKEFCREVCGNTGYFLVDLLQLLTGWTLCPHVGWSSEPIYLT